MVSKEEIRIRSRRRSSEGLGKKRKEHKVEKKKRESRRLSISQENGEGFLAEMENQCEKEPDTFRRDPDEVEYEEVEQEDKDAREDRKYNRTLLHLREDVDSGSDAGGNQRSNGLNAWRA